MLQRVYRMTLIVLLFFFSSLIIPSCALAFQKGIYVTQWTAMNDKKFKKLVKRAKAVGINTFIVDYSRYSKRYHRNLQLLDKHNIRHVARIVMFPGGATGNQMTNPKIWQKKYKLVQQIAKMGADEIQLDYIRYKVGKRASKKNAHDVHKVIHWYKQRVNKLGLPLQIDVFGVAAHKPSLSIGQNLPLFANSVDVVCPMVYPSHYEPQPYHSRRPYETIADSLQQLKDQFGGKPPFKVIAYIETSNYRYRMGHASRMNYIKAQIKAAKDSGAHGWYAWSANNKYYTLFKLLESTPSI
ncbi:MAG: putative glycoside hydrolase [Coxiellaceae bacterium]|nr:putative glycoside hydrolase [Coxiellaceae bacterium]